MNLLSLIGTFVLYFGEMGSRWGINRTARPILLGAAKPVHIVEPSASVRRIVNITALAAFEA